MNTATQEEVTRLRRTQILNAAIKSFAARGFHRTTIHQVAREAGVADGTIYNYFENKTALLMAVLDPLNESEGRATDPMPPVPADVRAFFHQYFARRWSRFDDDSLAVLRVILAEVLSNPELRALYVDRVIGPSITLADPYVRQFIAQGQLRAVDVPLTLRSVTAIFLGLVMLRLMGDGPLHDRWDSVPDLLTTLLLDGLLPREGEHA